MTHGALCKQLLFRFFYMSMHSSQLSDLEKLLETSWTISESMYIHNYNVYTFDPLTELFINVTFLSTDAVLGKQVRKKLILWMDKGNYSCQPNRWF